MSAPRGEPGNPVAELERELAALDRESGAQVMDERLAETARLFYVACTRAISRLYMVGRLPARPDTEGRSFRGLLLKAWPWAGKASAKDRGPTPARPDGPGPAFGCLSIAPVPDAARGTPAGPCRDPAATAAADAPVIEPLRARMAVTAAAALAEARAAGAPAGGMPTARELREPSAREGFGDADFGTLCHEFTEALLREPSSVPIPSDRMRTRLSRVSERARAAILSEAMAKAAGFLGSGLGGEAAAARESAASGAGVFELEFPFVWRGEPGGRELFLSGAMDLVYGDADSVTVVDFKTDRAEEPGRHRFQLALYRQAAEAIFGRPARAFLHYLGSGRSFELTGDPDLSALDAMHP